MLVTPPNMEQPQVRDTTPKLQDVTAAAKSNLSDNASKELEELLTKYGNIFVMKSDDYRWTNRVYHHIDTGEGQPIRQPANDSP
jgi:hypothetical protein